MRPGSAAADDVGQRVDAAEAGDGARDQRRHGRLGRHVGHDHLDLHNGPERGGRLVHRGRREVHQHQAVAGGDEGVGGGLADPVAGTGHHGHAGRAHRARSGRHGASGPASRRPITISGTAAAGDRRTRRSTAAATSLGRQHGRAGHALEPGRQRGVDEAGAHRGGADPRGRLLQRDRAGERHHGGLGGGVGGETGGGPHAGSSRRRAPPGRARGRLRPSATPAAPPAPVRRALPRRRAGPGPGRRRPCRPRGRPNPGRRSRRGRRGARGPAGVPRRGRRAPRAR